MVSLFVGGHAGTIQGEREDLTGKRMFTAAHPPQLSAYGDISAVCGIIDSGAFTDRDDRRLNPEQALARQLVWEIKANEKWERYGRFSGNWQAYALVSYDRLIDEMWIAGVKHKRRWTVKSAETAIRETITAAEYLANQRELLAPRRLVLSVQGVDAIQYRECMQAILQLATPADIIGFGGWCILGRWTSWLPEFWRTLHCTIPLIAQAGIRDVHIFGVLYQPALGGMLYLADQYGLNVSTDSTAPIKACLWKTEQGKRKAGVRAESGYWRDNVQWWQNTLKNLRHSQWYRCPPNTPLVRQTPLF